MQHNGPVQIQYLDAPFCWSFIRRTICNGQNAYQVVETFGVKTENLQLVSVSLAEVNFGEGTKQTWFLTIFLKSAFDMGR